MNFEQQERLGLLIDRRIALRHAVMYLNKASEHKLAAKAGKSLYEVDQEIKGLERRAASEA